MHLVVSLNADNISFVHIFCLYVVQSYALYLFRPDTTDFIPGREQMLQSYGKGRIMALERNLCIYSSFFLAYMRL